MQAFVRLPLLICASAFALASASSTNNPPSSNMNAAPYGPNAPNGAQGANPASSQSIDPTLLLGVWKSNFGPVKIVSDTSGATGKLMGVWVYDRDGQEVIGYFSGGIRGNVLNFTWEEPAAGQPLRGGGYLQFDAVGASYSGRWWTNNRDRGGAWNGWREQEGQTPPVSNEQTGAEQTGPAEQAPEPITSPPQVY